MTTALLDDISTLDTLRIATPTSPKPALTLRTRQPIRLPAMTPFISILDVRFNATQKSLHPRLQCACAANGGGVLYGSLAELCERVKLPFQHSDLWALCEGGLIEVLVSGDWLMVSCK